MSTCAPPPAGPAAYLAVQEAPGLLTVRQVARRVGVKPKTVYGLVWAGRLEAVKVGGAVRISETALAAYLAENVTTRHAAGRVTAPRPAVQAPRGGYQYLRPRPA